MELFDCGMMGRFENLSTKNITTLDFKIDILFFCFRILVVCMNISNGII